HGAEIPATAAGLQYGSGFVAATALLHIIGLAPGLLGTRLPSRAAQLAGLAIAACGVALFVA
ncbi:MAG TPA: HupE/UreJ family protein, partial [Opitutus sp.]|nr:HupE/UreJ family protein [Opitutus sp.]